MSKWDEVERYMANGTELIPIQQDWGEFAGEYVRASDYDALLAHCKSLEAAQQNGPEPGICEAQYGGFPHRKLPHCINWRPTAVTDSKEG